MGTLPANEIVGDVMPSVLWNRRVWGGEHTWDQDGDEWSGMAAYCGQPYSEWKDDFVQTFMASIPSGARVLEIGPGHGRWTEYLIPKAETVALVDITESCLNSCRDRFRDHPNVSYHLTDACSLRFLSDSSIDFAWSFDAFVHMDPEVVHGYLDELGRVLAPRGHAVLHHADRPDWSLKLSPIARRMGRPGRVLQRAVILHRLRDDGYRSDVSARMVARWASAAGLTVLSQTDSWGKDGRHNVRKYRDGITILEKPHVAVTG
jgi:ubiquinone/menaquinone biosynthesis C-methylase UbiE